MSKWFELVVCSTAGITTFKFRRESSRERLLKGIEGDVAKFYGRRYRLAVKEYFDDFENRVTLVLPHITKVFRSQSMEED